MAADIPTAIAPPGARRHGNQSNVPCTGEKQRHQNLFGLGEEAARLEVCVISGVRGRGQSKHLLSHTVHAPPQQAAKFFIKQNSREEKAVILKNCDYQVFFSIILFRIHQAWCAENPSQHPSNYHPPGAGLRKLCSGPASWPYTNAYRPWPASGPHLYLRPNFPPPG